MIYTVFEVVKHEGGTLVCATNNLAFAEECYKKQKERASKYSDVWVELNCLDGQVYYANIEYKTILDSRYEE